MSMADRKILESKTTPNLGAFANKVKQDSPRDPLKRKKDDSPYGGRNSQNSPAVGRANRSATASGFRPGHCPRNEEGDGGGEDKRVFVDVLVVEAHNVSSPAVHSSSSLFGLFSSKSNADPDPYFKLSCGDQSYCTRVITRETNPVWNEDCTFTIDTPSSSDTLHICLFDRNNRVMGSDAFIGRCDLPLDSFPSNKTIDTWQEVRAVDELQHGQVMCELHLVIFKSSNMFEGMLAPFGRPMRVVPMRMAAGDILLVSSSAIITHGVKLATSSQWDHVAMIVSLRGKPNRLRLFEATMEGVECYALDDALRVYKESNKIAIRRLRTVRTKQMMKGLHDFVDEVKGRPYKQDYWQLVRSVYGANQQDDLSSLFCSQLIAAAYITMELLPPDIPSNNYLPGDFAGNITQRLLKGKLGPPIVIHREVKKQVTSKHQRGGKGGKMDEDEFEESLKGRPGADLVGEEGGTRAVISSATIASTMTMVGQSKKKFTAYIVEVECNRVVWRVSRRYNDFYALDKLLRRKYNMAKKLPPKTYTVNKFDPLVIKQRCAALQEYMETLVASEMTASDSHFLLFLDYGGKARALSAANRSGRATGSSRQDFLGRERKRLCSDESMGGSSDSLLNIDAGMRDAVCLYSLTFSFSTEFGYTCSCVPIND